MITTTNLSSLNKKLGRRYYSVLWSLTALMLGALLDYARGRVGGKDYMPMFVALRSALLGKRMKDAMLDLAEKYGFTGVVFPMSMLRYPVFRRWASETMLPIMVEEMDNDPIFQNWEYRKPFLQGMMDRLREEQDEYRAKDLARLRAGLRSSFSF